MDSGFPEPLQQVKPVFVRWRGRKFVYFGGCDYLRLSAHPAVSRAAQEAIRKYGLNVAASRRTTGNHVLYEELEEATRRFFGVERAILVPNGYLTNLAAAQGLRGTFQHAFIDEKAHFSLRDALSFLGCPSSEFAHRDPADLRAKVRKRAGRGRLVVLTDGIFAHDGSIAPLAAYRQVIGERAFLWVDDAHAAGLLGAKGRGSLEFAGIGSENTLQTITFSKAFGAFGGAILCDRTSAAKIIAGSGAILASTPVPLSMAAAARAALQVHRAQPELREKLWENVSCLWNEMKRSPEAPSPILAVSARNPAILKRQLLLAGIYPSLIEYGTGPAFFRFAISSAHSTGQIKELARILAASSET